jgi:hypothetical protein
MRNDDHAQAMLSPVALSGFSHGLSSALCVAPPVRLARSSSSVACAFAGSNRLANIMPIPSIAPAMWPFRFFRAHASDTGSTDMISANTKIAITHSAIRLSSPATYAIWDDIEHRQYRHRRVTACQTQRRAAIARRSRRGPGSLALTILPSKGGGTV